jgi:hypothetical protein
MPCAWATPPQWQERDTAQKISANIPRMHAFMHLPLHGLGHECSTLIRTAEPLQRQNHTSPVALLLPRDRRGVKRFQHWNR